MKNHKPRFARTAHPETDNLPADHGLTAYDVTVDGEHVGQVWQVNSGHYWGRGGRTTGWTFVPQVTWTYTDAPFGEELDTRRDAVASLVRAALATCECCGDLLSLHIGGKPCTGGPAGSQSSYVERRAQIVREQDHKRVVRLFGEDAI